MNTELTLAICKEVSFGVRDVGTPVLSFSVFLSEREASSQVLSADRALQIMKELQLQDFKELEARACWVVKSTDSVKFVRFWGQA